MSSEAKYSDRFKKEVVKEKETSKEPVVSTKSFADFPSLGGAKVVEKAAPKSTPWAQTLKESIATAAALTAAAEIKQKAEQEANRIVSTAPQWAPSLRVKGYEENVYDEFMYAEEEPIKGYNGYIYEEDEEEETRTPPYR